MVVGRGSGSGNVENVHREQIDPDYALDHGLVGMVSAATVFAVWSADIGGVDGSDASSGSFVVHLDEIDVVLIVYNTDFAGLG